MTEREKQQQKEIERLQNKLKTLSEAYSHTVEKLNQIESKEKKAGKKGRPPIDTETKARVLSLCHQGRPMRKIAAETGISLGTVHKIIAKASAEIRIVYIYMDRQRPSTLIDTCSLTHKVKITNFTNDMVSRAFGIKETPDWNDYTEFLEDRCMPRTRYGIREELKYMGLDVYDPFQIIAKTSGRVYGDGQWLKHMTSDWVQQYDKLLKEEKNEATRKERILKLLKESGVENEYHDSAY